MKKIIIVAGYSKSSYIQSLQSHFQGKDIMYVCVYGRTPETDVKKSFLSLFDTTIDIRTESAQVELEKIQKSVIAVTCTQERDMETYFQVLEICEKITEEQKKLYKCSVDKKHFKDKLSRIYPELVPKVIAIDTGNIQKLDSATFPLVVKPTGLAGSSFVQIVHSATEVREFLDALGPTIVENGKKFFQRSVEIIAEEFIVGKQFSINAYVNKTGEITLCPLIRVIPAFEVGIHDSYSAYQYVTDEVPSNEQRLLLESLKKIVTTFKIKNTSVHFDGVLNENGDWKFFEMGLRIGGKRQHIFELSHRFNHVVNDVSNRMGETIRIPKQLREVCVVQRASECEGIFESYSLPRTITKPNTPLIHEDKVAKIGEVVKPVALGGGTLTRHIVVGSDLQAVLDESKHLFKTQMLTIT